MVHFRKKTWPVSTARVENVNNAASRLTALREKSLGSGTVPAFQSLIRTMIAQTRRKNKADSSDRKVDLSTDEIIVDAEVDGVRYLLVRPRQCFGSSVSFSPREQEIARMVAMGYPNKTIADVLQISQWTVCTHLRRVFAKLGVSSRAAMVARLIQNGILMNLR